MLICYNYKSFFVNNEVFTLPLYFFWLLDPICSPRYNLMFLVGIEIGEKWLQKYDLIP